ncbi:MAG: DUF503 domain-containing protein [Anaerolineales bacterium]
MIGLLTLRLRLPGCASLKEKRGRIKPLLHRLHREFNVSAAEMDLHDRWQEAVIACGMVSNNAAHLQAALETICKWTEAHWTDGDVLDSKIEVI